jgi:glycosyltransferase involved in cell wall biosynthesis
VNHEIPKVTVLLTTFNGVRFLEEQLTSLFGQQGVEIEIMVNDDGSTDGTIEVLDKWRAKGFNISVSQSKGLGPTRAFLSLLQSCGDKQFVAFCDQDDIWEPNKLVSQVQLCKTSRAFMSFSERTYIDSLGRVIGNSRKLRNQPTFENALIENIAPGNTIFLNSSAIELINSYVSPNITHYDSWIYLLVSGFGECEYISKPLVRYRLHENNHVGVGKFKVNRFETSALQFIHQASYLFKVSKHDLGAENTLALTKFTAALQTSGKVHKTKAIFRTKFNRQRFIDQIGFKVTFLLLIAKGKI